MLILTDKHYSNRYRERNNLGMEGEGNKRTYQITAQNYPVSYPGTSVKTIDSYR